MYIFNIEEEDSSAVNVLIHAKPMKAITRPLHFSIYNNNVSVLNTARVTEVMFSLYIVCH